MCPVDGVSRVSALALEARPCFVSSDAHSSVQALIFSAVRPAGVAGFFLIVSVDCIGVITGLGDKWPGVAVWIKLPGLNFASRITQNGRFCIGMWIKTKLRANTVMPHRPYT